MQNGTSNFGSTSFMSSDRTAFSKHFITIKVRAKIIVNCGTGLFRHWSYNLLLPQSCVRVQCVQKSWQAIRAGSLAHTYSAKETADDGRVDFQAAGVISIWQENLPDTAKPCHTPERSFDGRILGKSHSACLIFVAHPG